MEKMTKEQFAEYKQQFLERKRKAYEAEPEVAKLVKTKRLLWRILAVCWVVHCMLTIIVTIQMQADTNIFLEIIKTLFQVFWLFVFINPEGTWRLNVMLYISAGYNLLMIVNEYQRSLKDILPQLIQRMPVFGLIFLMETLLPFLLLGIAFYLTLPKAHREQAERAQAIIKELQNQPNL